MASQHPKQDTKSDSIYLNIDDYKYTYNSESSWFSIKENKLYDYDSIVSQLVNLKALSFFADYFCEKPKKKKRIFRIFNK